MDTGALVAFIERNPAAGWILFIVLVSGLAVGIILERAGAYRAMAEKSRRAEIEIKAAEISSEAEAVDKVSRLVNSTITTFNEKMEELKAQNAQGERRIALLENQNKKLRVDLDAVRSAFEAQLARANEELKIWREGAGKLFNQIVKAGLDPAWFPPQDMAAGGQSIAANPTPPLRSKRSPLGSNLGSPNEK